MSTLPDRLAMVHALRFAEATAASLERLLVVGSERAPGRESRTLGDQLDEVWPARSSASAAVRSGSWAAMRRAAPVAASEIATP